MSYAPPRPRAALEGPPVEALTQLADLERLVGVASTIIGSNGIGRTASVATRCAVLRAMGHDVTSPADASTALLVERRRREAQVISTVLVAWDGEMESPVGCPDGLEWTVTPSDLNEPSPADPIE